MYLRWTAAGMLEAEHQFRRIIGHPDLAKLALALERDVAAKRATDTPATTAHKHTTAAAPKAAATPGHTAMSGLWARPRAARTARRRSRLRLAPSLASVSIGSSEATACTGSNSARGRSA